MTTKTKRAKRSITLTPEQDAFIDDLVQSGEYQSASEVVRWGLRLAVRDREFQHERMKAELEEIRHRLRESVEAMEAGRVVSGTPEEVIGAAFDKAMSKRGV